MRRYILVCVWCALICALCGCSVQQRIKRADKKFAIGEYFAAADIYKECYGRLSTKKDRDLKGYVAYQQGECYRIINNPRAANCYQSALRCKYYQQDSIIFLHTAQVLQYQGKYKDAAKSYELYLEAHPEDYVAKAGKYACLKIDEWKKETSRYKISEAKQFNVQRTSNFAPMFIGQQNDALMFSSNRQEKKTGSKKLKRPSNVTGQQLFQLFQTRKNAAGQWEEIVPAEGLAGDQQQAEDQQQNDSTAKQAGSAEMGVCTFTRDGRTMYFTYSKPINGQDLGAKIYKSERASGEWGEAQELKIFADSSITVGHPALSPSGTTLYFVSDAPGGQGGKDIWVAELSGDSVVDPQPLPASINTSADEMYPYVHADGTLYFASNGHPGYGGLDIFKAEPDTTSKDTAIWVLYNMGAPFNTNGDDFGITFDGNSQNGFFSSNRNDKKGFDKIYQFTLPEMEFLTEGLISDDQGNALSDATIRIVGSDGTNSKISARRDGTYKVKLKRDVKYVMLVTARGFLNTKEQFNTLDMKDSKTYHFDFVLNPISRPVKMENIFYEFGHWEITKASETELLNLVKLLQDNPNITIELSAHTDLVGNEQFNQELSQKRAQSCCDFLIKHGIEKERLTPVGYGKQKPVVADKTLHEKYKFIPQEQVLDEAFILSLPADQQEVCNQINRRTEFKVLKTTYKLY
ncbi:MAG: PD40 domain-containing protein [Paludibacteraceae bacterium]|nr:PD40 domain-containing protein [Paludibacteraceae bacterium]